MSKFALSVTLACLFAVAADTRGDEPAGVPVESKPGDAASAAATPAVPATSQPQSAGSRVIIIQTTPDLEQSEVIGKLIEALEKEGIAKRSIEDGEGKPADFQAVIVAQADMPAEKIRKLIETLKALSIERASIQLGPADGVSEVIVTCPADVTFQRVRTLHESLVKQEDFKIDVRVAGSDGPVTSTGPTMFTRPLQPLASPVDGRRFRRRTRRWRARQRFRLRRRWFRPGAGSVAMGLPASAIPGRKWVAGAKVIVAFSDDGKQVLAYSEQHPRWASQELEPVSGAVAVPVVSDDSVAVRYGNYCYAYSTTLGTWDVLKLPPGEVAIPAVSDEGIGVHSASQGDFVFKNSWGKWFSADEIKAGRVAEFLQTRQATVPAAQALVDPELQIGVFQLENIDATDAAHIVRQLYGKAINPVVDVRTNSLVCKDAPSVLEEIEALLLQLDSTATKAPDLPTPAQSVDGLRKLYGELELRTQELAAKLRHPAHNPATVKQLQDELRETVRQAFEARQNLQRAELAEFSQRLKGIQQSIEIRDRISQQIIDRRVEELLDPNLKWDAPTNVSENQVPSVRDDEHATSGKSPKSTPPADESSNRLPGGKPLKPVVRIAFDKRQLGKIDWLAGPGSLTVDGFGKGLIVTPIGSTTSLRLTDLPGRDNAAMFVTLQIVGSPSNDLSRKGVLNPVELLAHNPIPLQITDEDRDRVLSGEFVTKWIYLPHDLSTAGESIFNTVDSSRSEPGSTQIGEVEKLGVVVAILRLSNRPEPPEVVPPTSRPQDVSPRISIRTLPDEFVCWELFGAKFRKVVDELAGIPFHSQGLQIVELRPNGPAENAGLRVGDIVVIIDTQSVGEISHVKYALQEWQDSGVGKRARQVTFVRGNETRRAVRRLAGDRQRRRSDLDYEHGLLLDVRETLMRELVELESANSDVADDGKDTGQAVGDAEAAQKRVQLIASVKSKLEEVDDRLRILAKQQAILQDQANVSPDSIPDSDRTVIQRAVVAPAQVTGNRPDTPTEESLPSLRLEGEQVTVESLAVLTGKAWDTVTLADARFDGPVVAALCKAKSIRTLRLFGDGLSGQIPRLKHVAGLTGLELGGPLTSGGIQALSELTQLERLKLPHELTLNVTGARYLARMVNLKSLGLYHVDIDDASFVELKSLVNLEELDLTHTTITDGGLQTIASMPRLKRLYLDRYKQQQFPVRQLTDACIPLLLKLRELEDLSLSGKITDNGLKQLASLGKLKRLFIVHTEITGAGLAGLEDSVVEDLTIGPLGLDAFFIRGASDLPLFQGLRKCRNLQRVTVIGEVPPIPFDVLEKWLPGVSWNFEDVNERDGGNAQLPRQSSY